MTASSSPGPLSHAAPDSAFDGNIDLLHPLGQRRIDTERTELSILLAFSGASSGGLFAEVLEQAKPPVSSWEPAAFAADLFLKQFVTTCLTGSGKEPPISVPYLVKLLVHPPSERAVVEYRRAILGELASSPALETALHRLYGHVCRFRTLLEGTSGAAKWDLNRRQLDILLVVREIVDEMVDGFRSATSGLAKLHAFGRRIQAGEPYQSLVDLLRYDEKLATLNLKIGIGADGRIRGFQIVSVQENADNPFVSSPLRRWLAKIELFVRGYRFGDGEIMARLIDAVFEGVKSELVSFMQLAGDLEFYLGALTFRDRAGSRGLAVCLPTLAGPTEPRELVDLFNPLLLGHGVTPVPCTLRTDRHDTTVLVTGPNSGGKTRLLQSLALTELLAQSGLFIPARQGRIALVPGLVVSLIEEARPDQVEGRLGTELMRIRALFERLPPGAMVILDELCSGTNPSEGEEIFELVVRMLGRLKPQAFITTHFLGFVGRLEREGRIPDLRFLQVELGPGEAPTYQFIPGVARTSLAAHAAARLGVTGEQLLSLIEQKITDDTRALRTSKA